MEWLLEFISPDNGKTFWLALTVSHTYIPTFLVNRAVSIVSGILFSVYIIEPLKAAVLALLAVMRRRKVDIADWIPPLRVPGTSSWIYSTILLQELLPTHMLCRYLAQSVLNYSISLIRSSCSLWYPPVFFACMETSCLTVAGILICPTYTF